MHAERPFYSILADRPTSARSPRDRQHRIDIRTPQTEHRPAGTVLIGPGRGGGWATLWAASSIIRLDRGEPSRRGNSFQPGAEPHGLALASDGTLWSLSRWAPLPT